MANFYFSRCNYVRCLFGSIIVTGETESRAQRLIFRSRGYRDAVAVHFNSRDISKACAFIDLPISLIAIGFFSVVQLIIPKEYVRRTYKSVLNVISVIEIATRM